MRHCCSNVVHDACADGVAACKVIDPPLGFERLCEAITRRRSPLTASLPRCLVAVAALRGCCRGLVVFQKVERLCEVHVAALGGRGIRAMAVAKTDGATGAWQLLGLLTFLDPPRPDTKETIRKVQGTWGCGRGGGSGCGSGGFLSLRADGGAHG